MSKDNRSGAAKQVAGSLKEAIGKITGDSRTQAEGTAEKKSGEIERVTSSTKDSTNINNKK